MVNVPAALKEMADADHQLYVEKQEALVSGNSARLGQLEGGQLVDNIAVVAGGPMATAAKPLAVGAGTVLKETAGKIKDAASAGRLNPLNYQPEMGTLGMNGGSWTFRPKLEKLPNDAIVCRGGSCSADRFENGSGVTINAFGQISGASVNSSAGKSLQEVAKGIPHGKIGVTTVGEIRSIGGDVVASPTRGNPNHATLSGITAAEAEKLMTPTVSNPNK